MKPQPIRIFLIITRTAVGRSVTRGRISRPRFVWRQQNQKCALSHCSRRTIAPTYLYVCLSDYRLVWSRSPVWTYCIIFRECPRGPWNVSRQTGTDVCNENEMPIWLPRKFRKRSIDNGPSAFRWKYAERAYRLTTAVFARSKFLCGTCNTRRIGLCLFSVKKKSRTPASLNSINVFKKQQYTSI